MTIRGIKPHIAALAPYVPGKPIEALERELGIEGAIKLASNENPLGPSPKAIEAIHATADEVNRYPDGALHDLRAALAAKHGVGSDQLVFGCGGDELLELLAKCLLDERAPTVYPWPSFAMYPIVTSGMGARPVPVPLDADLVHDLDALAAAVTDETRLVILCNPNNPTGTSVGAEAFDRFMASMPDDLVVAIDEAYYEYVRRPDFPDALGWVARRPNTFVLRTFSKIYGLAGLRVGYGIMGAELAGMLERARHPFNVSLVAERGALAALDDEEHVKRTREMNTRGAEQLAAGFDALGIRHWPTDANFILAETGAGTYEALLREGVIVRALGGAGLDQHVRISIGTERENARCLESLRRIRQEVA